MSEKAQESKGNGHGGRRAGAGRKPKSSQPKSCPPEILDALRKAKTAKQLDVAARALSLAAAEGVVERSRADVVLEILRERRHLLKEKRAERGATQVRALEILTPDEAEWIRAHRAKLAGAPLGPGEMAPPPEAGKGDHAATSPPT